MTVTAEKITNIATSTTMEPDALVDTMSFALNNNLNYVLDGATTTNQVNLKVDLFGSDTAQYLKFMKFDTDKYSCINIATTAWVIIEAASVDEGELEINNCVVMPMESGKWIMYGSTGDIEVSRAEIMKTLFYGSDGSDPKVIDGITSLTALKTSDSRDIGKRAFYAYFYVVSNDVTTGGYVQHTFDNTSDNNNCSSWSRVSASIHNTAGSGSPTSSWYIPSGTLRHSITRDYGGGGTTGTSVSDETGTDVSADENDNPADMKLNVSTGHVRNYGNVKSIILCKGNITEDTVGSGAFTSTLTDFYTNNSIPDFTEATDSDLTCILMTDSTTITTNDDVIIIKEINSLTSGNTVATEVSFDDGINWASITEGILKEFRNLGTNLRFRFTITRANNTETDNITSYAAYFG